jgi:hypothetical protein
MGSGDSTPRVPPVAVTFSPSWFHRHYGVDYREQTWANPVQRAERSRETARLLFDRFGDVGMGDQNPEPNPSVSDAYGNYFMPALFGCQIVYPPDQAPGNIQLGASIEEMRRLSVPDFGTAPVIRRVFSEAALLRAYYGSCHGGLSTGSPINVAMNVFGETFLMACASEPETAQHVLRVIAETEFRLYREVSAVIAPDEFPLPGLVFGYGNCPAVLFSPRMYREVILPVDLWVRRQVAEFHLHHCGVLDAYIEIYQELSPASLDIGGGSDYRAMRKAFPETPCSLIVNAPDIEGRTAAEVDELIGGMVAGASPVDLISRLWVAEVSERISDDTVRAVRTANERV